MKVQVLCNRGNAALRLLLVVRFTIVIFSIVQLTSASVLNPNETNADQEQLQGPSPRIVGGKSAADGQFPHQVSLVIANAHYCGGSIISPRYVVSAAHCLITTDDQFLNATQCLIRAGSTDSNSGGVVLTVVQIIMHPRFVLKSYDIALFRLSEELIFSDRIKAIPLATAEPPVGAALIISGWGHLYQNSSTPKRLQYTTVHRISRDQCQREIGYVDPSIICLGHPPGNGACYGDSGGPAVYNGKLVGVASFIYTPCASKYPDGYTNVYMVRNWLRLNSDVN